MVRDPVVRCVGCLQEQGRAPWCKVSLSAKEAEATQVGLLHDEGDLGGTPLQHGGIIVTTRGHHGHHGHQRV